MAWPSEAGSIARHLRGKAISKDNDIGRGETRNPALYRGKHYFRARGKYRIFNTAVYRFYRKLNTPPTNTTPYYSSNATLPYEPSDTFSDGTWYLSMSKFNGVIDSGFYPVGDAGETYVKMVLSAGTEEDNGPHGPSIWMLELIAGGVVRIVASYFEDSTNRADTWAITYTTNGDEPAEDTPDYTETMASNNVAILVYDLPAQVADVVVKVRLQTKRDDVYSNDSTVKTITVVTTGPDAPPQATAWHGLPPSGEI